MQGQGKKNGMKARKEQKREPNMHIAEESAEGGADGTTKGEAPSAYPKHIALIMSWLRFHIADSAT